MANLNADSVRRFMTSFFGYGSWNANLWFVGMEEGGGESIDEIERRLTAWDGSDELADVRDFHRAIGSDRWFRRRPPIQSTWGKLIRVALAAAGRATDNETVRTYQRDELARRDGETALIELFPLPSPSTSEWLYGDTCITDLATRARYLDALAPQRIAQLRRRIVTHQPHAVVFYGSAYRRYWEEIAATAFTPVASGAFDAARSVPTIYILTAHPVGHGVTNRQFEAIGEYIQVGQSK